MKPKTLPTSISIAILYHAGTKDDDVDTLKCVKGIEEALIRSGHVVHKVEVTQANWQETIKTPGDVVFNLVEDDLWELYVAVGLALDNMGRVQVGHEKKSFTYVTHKAGIKRQMQKLGISTPKSIIIDRQSSLSHNLSYPVIVKPSEQHAGIGISQASIVNDDDALKKQVQRIFYEFPGEIIVEEFIKGREIHATVIGNGSDIHVLPYCEIGYGEKSDTAWNIYSYDAKWDKKSWEYWNARVHAPAVVSAELSKNIDTIARTVFKTFYCRDIVRMDIRVDEQDQPFVIDVNMNPSLNYYDDEDATLVSVYAMGWTYDQFIETIAAFTYKRTHRSKQSLQTRKFLS